MMQVHVVVYCAILMSVQALCTQCSFSFVFVLHLNDVCLFVMSFWHIEHV